MVRSILLLIAVFSNCVLSGQGNVVLQGLVRDAATERPLRDAHISLKGSTHGAVSDADGSFRLVVTRQRHYPLEVTLVGYASTEVLIDHKTVESGEVVQIRLLPKAVDLPAVTIRRPLPEVVYQRSDLHVGDYFTNDEGLWVLTYDKPKLWHKEGEAGRQVFRNARLHLLDTNFVEQGAVNLPTEVCRLRRDASHRTIVEGIRSAWVATREGGEVRLQEISLKVLRENVLPWTDSIPGRLLGSNYDETFPAFEHFAFDPVEDTTRAICGIQDDLRMALFRSQYKYMSGADKVAAMDLALETGVDAEIIAGYMTGFHKNIYFDAPYAPLFVVNDTLCVFDHYSERVRRFLPDLTEVGSVPITHQKERNWKTRLLQDRRDGQVYALFERNLDTWLRRVDPRTGELGPVRGLDHPDPDDVQVHGGHAYFIYRPFGSLQHRTLYRQVIK